jgi:hypothetical protein
MEGLGTSVLEERTDNASEVEADTSGVSKLEYEVLGDSLFVAEDGSLDDFTGDTLGDSVLELED